MSASAGSGRAPRKDDDGGMSNQRAGLISKRQHAEFNTGLGVGRQT